MRTSREGHAFRWNLLLAVGVSVLVIHCTPAPGAEPPFLACSPDKATVAFGESVLLRAWATSVTGQDTRYEWDVTVGRLEGRGAEVRWNLADVRPGKYAAAVRIAGRRGAGTEECLLRVVVRQDAGGRGGIPSSPVPARETGGALLLSHETEAPGYGLYTYLLLGSPPSDSARERYLKTLEAYSGIIPQITLLEQYVARTELNVAYLPIRVAPDTNPAADWLLGNYDYARARSVLRLLPGANREGPYIVSTLRPLGGPSGSLASPNPYLFQDLSKVPPHLLGSWIKEFLNQAAQERFWEERTAERLALKLRVTVGVMGAALPEVKKALDTWIAWVH